MYKIVNNHTGRFSSGGQKPGWERNGRVWQTLDAVTAHINSLTADGQRVYVEGDATIVEFAIHVKSVIDMPEFPKPQKVNKPKLIEKPKRTMDDLRKAFVPPVQPRANVVDVERTFNRYILRQLHDLAHDMNDFH